MHDDDPLGRDDGPAGIGDNSGDESGGEDGRAVERLIELLARLPGLGPRSARRAALHLVRKRDLTLAPLAEAMTEVARTVKPCAECGNISTSGRCGICRDPRRDAATLCVAVQRLRDRVPAGKVTDAILFEVPATARGRDGFMLRVNDDGSGMFSYQEECDYADNEAWYDDMPCPDP